MTPVFATQRLRLSRLARIRALRMLACLLAISLAFGGYLAAAAPLHASMAGASTAAGESCSHDGMAMPAKHAPASDTCCRVSCACAFVHAIGAIAPIGCASSNPASTPIALAPDARAPGGVDPPPLRPPIA